MLRRILPHVAPADEWWVPSLPGWLGIAFTFEGLKALGVPQASLDSFPIEFRQGMAARAAILHDFGANAPANWEYPFGTPDAHVALAIYAKTIKTCRRSWTSRARAITTSRKFRSCTVCSSANCRKDATRSASRTGCTILTSKEAVQREPAKKHRSRPASSSWAIPTSAGKPPHAPIPAELRRNGTFVAIRKFHMDVAAFRRYLRAQASSPEEEELIAAKMVGRWRSGAPLVLAPDRDDPAAGHGPKSQQ